MKNYTNLNRLYDSHNEDDFKLGPPAIGSKEDKEAVRRMNKRVIGTTGEFGDVELQGADTSGWGELMSMTVQEMLDKVGAMDTRGDAEYEVLEASLKAVCPKICSGSYDNDTDLDSPDSVEVDDETSDLPTELEDTANQFPTWSEESDKEDLENFEF